MIRRCYNPDDAAYGRYGGRGIFVCPQWKDSIKAFFKDMGRRPSSQYSLDRIDNDKGYSPDNCRWAIKREQARNRRTSRILTWNGKSMTAAEWSERTGIRLNTIYQRLDYYGWSVADALSKSARR